MRSGYSAVTDQMAVGRRSLASASCRIAKAEGLPAHMQDGTREVLDVTASNQRKGHATKLMHTVCAEADRAGITLILTCKQFQDGMTDEQLMKWYERFGFIPIQEEPVIMARQVQVTQH